MDDFVELVSWMGNLFISGVVWLIGFAVIFALMLLTNAITAALFAGVLAVVIWLLQVAFGATATMALWVSIFQTIFFILWVIFVLYTMYKWGD